MGLKKGLLYTSYTESPQQKRATNKKQPALKISGVYHKVALAGDEATQNKIHKRLVHHYCSRRHIEVVSFATLVQALPCLQNENAAKQRTLVLPNPDIPFSGWDFVEHPNLANRNITPVYVVSSSGKQADIEKAYNYPSITGYLIKPGDLAIEGLLAGTLAVSADDNDRKR